MATMINTIISITTLKMIKNQRKVWLESSLCQILKIAPIVSMITYTCFFWFARKWDIIIVCAPKCARTCASMYRRRGVEMWVRVQACVSAALLGADMRRTFYFIIFGNKKIKICAGARACVDSIIDVRVRACAAYCQICAMWIRAKTVCQYFLINHSYKITNQSTNITGL